MTKHEKISKSPEFSEAPVAKRYSFAKSELARSDILSGYARYHDRFIDYPRPIGLHKAVRTSLISRNLLLGDFDSTNGVFDRFKVQNGAKPILHGAIVRTMGDYTYNDINLFTDLGKLLRDYGLSLGEKCPVELIGDIGLNVAIVDYTQQNEKGLFLVPGSEFFATPTARNQNETLDIYIEKLNQEFGVRFVENKQSFMDGFQSKGK